MEPLQPPMKAERSAGVEALAVLHFLGAPGLWVHDELLA